MGILHVGYSKAKKPRLGRNLKVPKSQKKDSKDTLNLFYAANGLKNRLIFENLQDFEKWQIWPYCMDYSKAKWPILGRNLKVPKS